MSSLICFLVSSDQTVNGLVYDISVFNVAGYTRYLDRFWLLYSVFWNSIRYVE